MILDTSYGVNKKYQTLRAINLSELIQIWSRSVL